jgi:hypothetical protein
MRGLVAALALLLPCGCRKASEPAAQEPSAAPVERGPARVVEIEPNDFLRAQPIPERAIVDGSFEPKGRRAPDDDWYRVAPGPGRALALRVEMTLVRGDAGFAGEAWLEVLDRDRNRLLRMRADGAEPALVPSVACVEACFVRVTSDVAGRYSLSVLGEPARPDREMEPNDRLVDATPLSAGGRVEGTYGTADDEDWYRLEIRDAKPGQFLRIQLTGVLGVRPELELRTLDGALAGTMRPTAPGDGLVLRDLALPGAAPPRATAPAQDAGQGGATAPDPNTAPSGASSPDGPGAVQERGGGGGSDAGPGSAGAAASGYFLVLRSAPFPGPHGKTVRGANPRVPYTLSAALETGPEDLEIEPNDDVAHATDLVSSRSGYLSPPGDADWYRIHVEQPMILHAEVSALDRADVELSVFAPGAGPADKPTLLARANEGGLREGEVVPAVRIPAGDSYVMVTGAARQLDGKWVRDAEDPDNLYKLSVSLSPDDGSVEREPNDSIRSAQELPLPASTRGWIWPRKDVDVFRFHVPSGAGPSTIRLSAVRGVDLQLRLFELRGASGEVIGTSDSARGEGEERIVAVPLKEGDYAVEVSSPRNKDASATQAYTLTIRRD